MNEEEIINAVERFFQTQSPEFSEIWKTDIVSRLVEMNLKTLDESLIESIHEEKLKKIFTICEKIAARKSNLDFEQVNNLVVEAFIKWSETFDPIRSPDSKNPELSWLMFQVRQVAYEHSRGKNSRIDYADLEETFKSLADPAAQQLFEDIISGRNEAGLEDEYQTVTFEVEYSPVSGSKKSYTNKRFAYIASEAILKYLLLCKRASKINENELPRIVGSYKHNLTNFIRFHQHTKKLNLNLSLLDTSSVTGYAKARNHILCNADSRRWMELAVSELRESKEKKLRDISKPGIDSKTKKSITKAPVLSSVAVCKNGKVFTCFKGQVDQTINGRNISWDKHCEYSLFFERVGDERMSLLKGGTLFVTLEPCNTRKPISGTDFPKIPCAVRCLEADFDRIYIGSFDYRESIRGKGIEILETGKYKFDLKDGNYIGDPDEIKNAELLEKRFIEKGYELTEDSLSCRVYTIRNEKERPKISYFDADLMLEIYNLNADFQRGMKQKDDPHSFQLSVD